MSASKIGWIGLGHMGVPMVTNLSKAGYPVTVYNRTRAKAEALGVPMADTSAALAASVEVIITMLADDASQEEVLFGKNGVAEGLSAGQTVINMGTISPAASRAHAKRLQDAGVHVLDAPVSGSTKPAADGTLVILVGGERAVFERHQPIFDVLGKRSFYFGDHGQGANAKLAINMMLGLTLQALAEAMVLGTESGLDRDSLLEMIGETAVASPIIAMKTPAIRANAFPAAFPLKHMAKDFGLAVEAAKAVGAELPITRQAAESFAKAQDNGLGDADIMAILTQIQSLRESSQKA
ncbi:MAG TPA: NAD(P)-dependent oxidoreductase [Telmatospirillum sp.]|nr:NAD(P)-dependent oxidoreductase [Telmatospirillum sp.]